MVQYELAVKEMKFVAMVTSTGCHAWRLHFSYCKPEMQPACSYICGNQKCHCNGEFSIHGRVCCGKVIISAIKSIGMLQYYLSFEM